ALTMQWYHGKLYVGGQFDHAGGVPLGTGGIAVWDGETWSSMPGQFYTSPTQPNGARIADITVWRDSLYICGSFQTVDGQPVRQVAQYIGGDEDLIPVGLSEERPKATFTLSPNPTNGPLRLQGLPTGAQRVVVRDALGRVAHVQSTNLYQLELGHLPAGTYIVQVVDAGGAVRGQARFVRY
ncbi:MAG: T9SS type A sorting domain-containing protein, partial [Flavobacteriales bacterium]